MLAAATGRSSQRRNTRSGSAPSSAVTTPAASVGRHRRGVGLQRGEGGLGLVGQGLDDEADELADLHQHALHLAELLGDVLGGADGELLVEGGPPLGGVTSWRALVPAKRVALRAVIFHIRRERQRRHPAEPAPGRDERADPDPAGGHGGRAARPHRRRRSGDGLRRGVVRRRRRVCRRRAGPAPPRRRRGRRRWRSRSEDRASTARGSADAASDPDIAPSRYRASGSPAGASALHREVRVTVA